MIDDPAGRVIVANEYRAMYVWRLLEDLALSSQPHADSKSCTQADDLRLSCSQTQLTILTQHV